MNFQRGNDGRFVSNGKPSVDEAMRVAVKNGEILLITYIRKANIGTCWDYAEPLSLLEKFKFFQLNTSEIKVLIYDDLSDIQEWKLRMQDASVLTIDAIRITRLGLNE